MIIEFENIDISKTKKVENLDLELRTLFPNLLGWSYSYLEKALTLEFKDTTDLFSKSIFEKIKTKYPTAKLKGEIKGE